jgi:hypothetical protein
VGHDQDRLADVVEDDHPVIKGEGEVGQAAIVGGGVGEALGVADGVVGREPDGAAGEPGEAGEVDRPVPLDQPLQVPERVGRRGPPDAPGVVRRQDADLGPARLEPEERLGPEEAEPADLLAADDALEEERGGGALDPAEGRNGRQAVAHQLAVDRHAGGLLGPSEEPLE